MKFGPLPFLQTRMKWRVRLHLLQLDTLRTLAPML